MPQRRKLLAIVIVAVSILLGSFVVAYVTGTLTIDANGELLDHRRQIERLDSLLSSLKDAETGQRGYLLTGDERYLAPFNSGVTSANQELAKLAKNRNVSPDDLKALTQLSQSKFDEIRETIRVRRTQGLAAAIAIVNTDYGKDVMDTIRRIVGKISAQESHASAVALARSDFLVLLRTIIFAFLAALNLAILFWALRAISREITRREAAALELQRQRDLLEVTLSSIGDGVIVTDKQGCVTFLNQTAEMLTGWDNVSALGHSCATVFDIVNEDTRAIVESPVDKVLREGVVVGLANHTLLKNRNGGETPIDDSGSPIREADGAVRGVVLIFRDVAEQRAIERELLTTNEALKNANAAKDQFLATVSHELRTPLTPVLATLTTWEAGGAPPSPQPAELRMLRRNIELEARLIDDLLDLTRLRKGKLSFSLELTDVHDVLRNVVEMHQNDISRKRLSLTLKLDATRHYAHTDPGRLQQIYANILSNAIKFTPYAGQIVISSENDSTGHVVLQFTDDGIGMNNETLARLFCPFEQGEDVTAERYGGLGLGMAIAQALTTAQNGEIAASSKGVGQGSQFIVKFPATDIPALHTPSAPEASDSRLAAANGGSILIVEDHDDTAEVMARLLKKRGYSVERCATVAHALESLKANSFDLLVSDIGLPDGTGIELIQRIRQSSGLPAIALTGYGTEQDAPEYRDAGFDGMLTKPVNFQRLETLIIQLLSRDRNHAA
jgi:PAS domain S-box-containing protein